jgi:hypothetical protein
MRTEIRSRSKKGKIKNGGDGLSAIIKGKDYELIRRNESRYRRGDGLRPVDRGRHGSRVAKGFPRDVVNRIAAAKKSQTPSGQLVVRNLSARFPLPWSHYD